MVLITSILIDVGWMTMITNLV